MKELETTNYDKYEVIKLSTFFVVSNKSLEAARYNKPTSGFAEGVSDRIALLYQE